MAVFMAGAGGVTVWFALPRFREGEFGGVFTVPVEQIPPPDSPPLEFADGRFWVVNIGQATLDDQRQPGDYPLQPGVRVLYKVCVHLGCLYKWVPTNDRFECPCHGSKYLLNGVRGDGPARRHLDVLKVQVVDASGNVLVETKAGDMNRDDTAGAPLELPADAASIRIDTG